MHMKRGKDGQDGDLIIVEVQVVRSMKSDNYVCRMLFGAKGGVGACSDDANEVSSRLVLRDTPQTHCSCKAGNDLCAHVGAALMTLRTVQELPFESWDDFYRTCPESVKSTTDWPIPAVFAFTEEHSSKSAKDARNKTLDDEVEEDQAEDQTRGQLHGSKTWRVVSCLFSTAVGRGAKAP